MSEKWDKEKLEQIVKQSKTISEVLEALGLNISSGNYRTFHKYISKYKITISHFVGSSHKRVSVRRVKSPIESILTKNSWYSRTCLKKRLINEGLIKYQCDKCKISKWMGGELSLQLDHINGCYSDNRIENLRLLCPNCHSQTKNYAGRGKAQDPVLCPDCGKKINRSSKHCRSCSKRRLNVNCKIQWPPNDELLRMVKESNFVKVSKQLGVSDNAIRKRLKNRNLL